MKQQLLAGKGVQSPGYDKDTHLLTYNYTQVRGYHDHAVSTLNYMEKELDKDWYYDPNERWNHRVEFRVR